MKRYLLFCENNFILFDRKEFSTLKRHFSRGNTWFLRQFTRGLATCKQVHLYRNQYYIESLEITRFLVKIAFVAFIQYSLNNVYHKLFTAKAKCLSQKNLDSGLRATRNDVQWNLSINKNNWTLWKLPEHFTCIYSSIKIVYKVQY